MKLYNADGIAAAVDFKLHAEIRPRGGGWSCPDEDEQCSHTRWVLCAMNASPLTFDTQISLLGCWDGSSQKAAEDKIQTCAATLKLDFDSMSKCNSGAQGLQLMTTEGDYNVQRYPGRVIRIPWVEIDSGEKLLGGHQRSLDYTTLLEALCSTGIKAGACHSIII